LKIISQAPFRCSKFDPAVSGWKSERCLSLRTASVEGELQKGEMPRKPASAHWCSAVRTPMQSSKSKFGARLDDSHKVLRSNELLRNSSIHREKTGASDTGPTKT
jgi:hypothetical protein